VGVRRELSNNFITACKGKPLWSTTAFDCSVCEIKHHDVVSSGFFADESPNKHPRWLGKHGSITVRESTEAYMVEVTVEIIVRSSN